MLAPAAQKGFVGTVRRAALLPVRYGITAARMGRKLKLMGDRLRHWEITPTIPITATLLRSHPETCGLLSDFDVAIHGYRHVAYSEFPMSRLTSDLDASVEIFEGLGLAARGFRAPYLRPHPRTWAVLTKRGFAFDSSGTDFILPEGNPVTASARALAFARYGGNPLGHHVRLVNQGLVELPVSLPDDEILTDGLSIDQPQALWRIFESMLTQVRASGGLFVVQVHPERFHLLDHAVTQLLAQATEDTAWKASLSEVADCVLKSGEAVKWPGGSPYAVSVTGDLDALTMGDFVTRFLGG